MHRNQALYVLMPLLFLTFLFSKAMQHWPQRKLQSLALNDLMYRQELAQKVNEATNTDLGPRYCRTLSCI